MDVNEFARLCNSWDGKSPTFQEMVRAALALCRQEGLDVDEYVRNLGRSLETAPSSIRRWANFPNGPLHRMRREVVRQLPLGLGE